MKFRKKPVVIEAIQLQENGHNVDECYKFCGTLGRPYRDTGYGINPATSKFCIRTIEGERIVECGDWIIKDDKGYFYSCKPDIFAKSYDPVD